MAIHRFGLAQVIVLLTLIACAGQPPDGAGSPNRPPDAALVDLAWHAAPGQPLGRTEAHGAVVDGVLYVFGGYTAFSPTFCTSRDVHAFDPAAGTWSPRRAMPRAWTHAGVAVDGSSVYLAAGREPTPDAVGDCGPVDVGSDEVWRYDTVADTWHALPRLPSTRSSGGLAVLGRTLHFVTGVADVPTADEGFEESGAHWTLDLDAPSAWSPRAALPVPRSHLGTVVLEGSLYVVGGQIGEQAALRTQTHVHRYDADADVWTERARLPAPVGHVAASTLAVEGQIIVLGGERAHNEPVDDVWGYDPVSDRWYALPPLPTATRSAVAGWIDGALWLLDADFSTRAWRGVAQ